MLNTLEVLAGEGETITITKVKKRRVCEYCGEPAHHKHTFLLPNARSNPASSGYGKDNISWCSDASTFTCLECSRQGRNMDGYNWCSTFPANKRFAHMFLFWEEKE